MDQNIATVAWAAREVLSDCARTTIEGEVFMSLLRDVVTV